MSWWRRRDRERDLEREIRAHLDLEAEEQRARGASPDAATHAARRNFGAPARVMEEVRAAWGFAWLHDLRQDLRYGLRAMLRSPAFTAAGVLTLALGMGANTAIFSLIDTVLLRSLPVQDPASLYFVENAGARGGGGSPPYPCFERFRAQAKSLAGISAYAWGDFGIRIDGPIEQVDGARVSGNYDGLLGLTPFAGRLLTVADEQLNPPVAVITYAFWQRRFGGDPSAIGRTFTLDERRFTIVGITPRDFHGLMPGHSDDITIPLTISGPKLLADTGSWWFDSIARLKPGVTAEKARAEIDPIFQAYMSQYAPSAEARHDYFAAMQLTPAGRGMDGLRKRFSRPLWALMAVVGVVLLIACANITNLLLARAAARRREFAIRVAIGAGRARLFRQLLVETGLLFATGALAGMGFAWWGTRAIVAFFSRGAHPILLDAHWDWPVFGFTAGLSLLATLIFGAAPLLPVVRADPHRAMSGGGRSTVARGRGEWGRLLVAFQVALSLILLVGAGLFLRTLYNLYGVDAGFRADQVALLSLHLPDPTYRAPQTRDALWDRLLEEVRGMPGVRSASLSKTTPLDGRRFGVRLEAPGFQPQSDEDANIGMNLVSEGYFATLGTRLLRGRDFTAGDRAGAPAVALLNESAARHFLGARDPVGALVTLYGRPCRIIGLVQNARNADLRLAAGRMIYVPSRQHPELASWMMLSIRTAREPQSLLAAVQSSIRGLGPDIQMVHAGTLAGQVDDSLLEERLISSLAAAFGALALLLSAVGLYGVLAYSVARRTSEIGIRMALGAAAGQVARGIVRQTLWLVALGLAIGVPAALALAGLVKNLLFGVTPTDSATLAGSAALLAVVALAAGYLPARRASRIDPLAALRHE